MTDVQRQIPPSMLRLFDQSPTDRAVVVLLRHSVRDNLPPGDAGNDIPITDTGYRLALELGGVLRSRLCTLHTSPILRCIQTAKALREGASANCAIVQNRLLGDPGVFVLDGRRAWTNWKQLGHNSVMRHLVNETAALPGMARPDEAARFLVQSMLAESARQPGVHVFVTHDSLVTATAARLLGKPLEFDDWPWYLEGAFFWPTESGVHVAYRDYEVTRHEPLIGLAETDIVEFARREVAATVGLDTGARFFVAGGAYKSLLTGRPPRDLDLWAPSEHDRALLLAALRNRGAITADERPYADAFDISGRIVEVPHKTEPSTLAGRLKRFDIALSAVGVEHRPDGEWSVMVHPLAIKSVNRREILLLKPLVNWKYALATLERMRRYALELSFAVPAEEEAEVWRVYDAQNAALRTMMIERYLRTGIGGFNIMEDVACRD